MTTHRGNPTARIENGAVHVITESCCYDYRIDSLTAEEAIALGSLILELGRQLLRSGTDT